MKTSKRFLAVLLAVLCLVLSAPAAYAATVASGNCGPNVTWTVDSAGVLTISGKGEMENYTSDDAPWENYKPQIKKIVIKEGVTAIGKWAFAHCEAKEVQIPVSVETIEVDAFDSAPILKYTVVSKNPYYCGGQDGCLYDKDKTQLLRYPIGSTRESFSVPRSVLDVSDSAFEEAENLKSVTLPDSVERIGTWAFSRCGQLETVKFPAHLKEIYPQAFYECEKLKAVNFSNQLEYIGEDAFVYCNALSSIEIPARVEWIADSAFANCLGLQKITVRAGNRNYASDNDGCLYNHKRNVLMQYPGGRKAASYSVRNGVETIAIYAFSEAPVQNVFLPDSVTTLGESAFQGCETLKSVRLSERLKTIEGYAFFNCKALTEILIPDSVATIGENAFVCCENLKSVWLSSSLKTIETDMFDYCTQLDRVTVPKSVTTIKSGAFKDCYGLREIKILNAACKIDGDETTISDTAVIYGQKGSTAQSYAKKHGRSFCTIDAAGNHVHTWKTVVTPARYHKDGKKAKVCTECGSRQSVIVIPAIWSISLSKTKLTYNGKKQMPKVTIKDSDGHKLKASRDYKLKYASGSKRVGTDKVEIIFKGNYSGQKTRTYKIVPGK